jgi:hypothetical protein
MLTRGADIAVSSTEDSRKDITYGLSKIHFPINRPSAHWLYSHETTVRQPGSDEAYDYSVQKKLLSI